MIDPNDILLKYATAFRDLVNARIWTTDESPRTALRLNDDKDWDFICVAMDVVGDASIALQHFLRFSLDGPTRYDETGERYLRLYGVLTAAYVQQQAVHKLFSLMQCPKPKDVKEQFDALEIRRLRHQLASHSLDCRQAGETTLRAFVPVRVLLRGFSCTITENRGDQSRTIELDEAIREHCRSVVSVLDRIYEKSIRTIFRGQAEKIAEFERHLEGLRFERNGNLILRVNAEGSHSEIRVVFVDSP